MMQTKLSHFIVLFLLVLPFFLNAQPPCGSPQIPPGTNFVYKTMDIEVCGEIKTREYLVHIPAHNSGDSLAVVFVYHGKGQNAGVFAQHWSGLQDSGLIIICPQASSELRCAWNAAHIARPTPVPDDFIFTDSLLSYWSNQDSLVAEGVNIESTTPLINDTLFYVSGFSSGAGFTWQLANHVDYVNRFKGYGPVANVFDEVNVAYGGSNWQNLPPKPVVFVFGTMDDAWEKFIVRQEQLMYWPKPPENMQQWLRRNQVNPNSVIVPAPFVEPNKPLLAALTQTYPPTGANSAAFEMITISGGGHYYPSPNVFRTSWQYLYSLDTPTRLVNFWQTYAGLPQ